MIVIPFYWYHETFWKTEIWRRYAKTG